MSPATYAILALIFLGCLYVLWLALQDPGSDNDDLEDWPGAIADAEPPWESADLTDTERREVEAVTERTIAWLRGIREES